MIDLTDFTFCIPVKIDSPERQENLDINLAYMRRHCQTNYLIGEEDSISKCKVTGHDVAHIFYKKDVEFFWRTRLLNRLFKKAQTRFIVNYDLDVFISEKAWERTAQILRQNFYSFVYPYNGVFYACPRKYKDEILKACDTDKHLYHSDFIYVPVMSLGGAVAARRDHYLEMGGENEFFRSWGAEDCERFCRWQSLQYRWTRVSNPTAVLYHLNHPTFPDSSNKNPFFKTNEAEYAKIQRMTTEQLQAYVKTWSWTKSR